MALSDAVTIGDATTRLPPELGRWLVEVRVEMELSKPTRFALRFEDDLCGGDYEVVSQPAFSTDPLRRGTMIGIFASPGPDSPDHGRQCLVYGPITRIKSSSAPGGTGSWTETHGEDRRVTMSRASVTGKYTGLASDTVQKILEGYGFGAAVQPTLIDYEGKDRQLSQNTDDLSFIEDQARRNNMESWVEYPVDQPIPEVMHFHSSPPRPDAAMPAPGAAPVLPVLTAPANRVLRVQMPAGTCGGGVTRFDTHIDFERPTAVAAFSAKADGQAAVQQIVENNAVFDPDRKPPAFAGADRRVTETKNSPSKEETYLALEAMVLEQSWFVTAEASTTLHLGDLVLRPHQVVRVENAGKILSGLYQVTKATHVINAADHFIDFSLRANGLGGPA